MADTAPVSVSELPTRDWSGRTIHLVYTTEVSPTQGPCSPSMPEDKDPVRSALGRTGETINGCCSKNFVSQPLTSRQTKLPSIQYHKIIINDFHTSDKSEGGDDYRNMKK